MKLAHSILFSASIINFCQCNDVIEYSQNARIRRDLSGYITNKFTDFVQDKLTQNSKALELIIKEVYKSEGLIKKLLGKFDQSGLRSKILGSIENGRRSRSYESNSDTDEFPSRIIADRPHGRHRRNVVSGVDLSKFVEFVEEKLMQHSSALEFIIKSVQNSEGLLKKLQRFDFSSVESKLLGAEDNNARRSENDNKKNKPTEKRSPFEQLSRFGNLAKRLIENEFGPDDPIPIEETEKEEKSEESNESVEATTKSTRRLFHTTSAPREFNLPTNEQSEAKPKESRNDYILTRRIGNFSPPPAPPALARDQNPWCASAATCQGDRVRVCGYDARYTYGVGQFQDVCHMLKYNCQSNYNFKVTPCDRGHQNGFEPKH